eukprot:14672899-Alexandrium_andersonii.AAC.1
MSDNGEPAFSPDFSPGSPDALPPVPSEPPSPPGSEASAQERPAKHPRLEAVGESGASGSGRVAPTPVEELPGGE